LLEVNCVCCQTTRNKERGSD